jgi:hypothetical protein
MFERRPPQLAASSPPDECGGTGMVPPRRRAGRYFRRLPAATVNARAANLKHHVTPER